MIKGEGGGCYKSLVYVCRFQGWMEFDFTPPVRFISSLPIKALSISGFLANKGEETGVHRQVLSKIDCCDCEADSGIDR
jgi:hypothetical protein